MRVFRHLAGLFAAAVLLAAGSMGIVRAQAAPDHWPAKPLRMIVPFPPGGPTDTASRILAQELAARLGQSVVVENRAGASGSIAAAQVKKEAPDGYTLMMLATPTLLAPQLFRSAGYDPTLDFAPVATVYNLPIVIVVNPEVLPGVADLAQLMQYAKAHPDMNYTSAGTGSFGHVSMEMLRDMGGFDMQHVPYKGGVAAITDTIGGQVPVMYADMVSALPHIRSGRLRAIAVGSPQRVAPLPDVATIAEQGLSGYDAESWGALLAPAGTPEAIVQRITDAVRDILAQPPVQEKMLGAGAIAHYQTPGQLQERIRRDYQRWGQIIRDKGIARQ